jgi:hypothetical protein
VVQRLQGHPAHAEVRIAKRTRGAHGMVSAAW